MGIWASRICDARAVRSTVGFHSGRPPLSPPALHGSMAPTRRDCSGWEMFLPAGRLLLFALLFHPGVAKVCNDRTKHEQDNSWFLKKEEALNIMVLMPMNESALMSSISQGIEPAVQLAIEHINDSGEYPFSLITKIYDTEVSGRVCECTCRPMRARACVCVCVSAHPRSALLCVCPNGGYAASCCNWSPCLPGCGACVPIAPTWSTVQYRVIMPSLMSLSATVSSCHSWVKCSGVNISLVATILGCHSPNWLSVKRCALFFFPFCKRHFLRCFFSHESVHLPGD